MKIAQLLNGHESLVSNEEHDFIKRYPSGVNIGSLMERDHWVAQNLVRKGVYGISNDNNDVITRSNTQ